MPDSECLGLRAFRADYFLIICSKRTLVNIESNPPAPSKIAPNVIVSSSVPQAIAPPNINTSAKTDSPSANLTILFFTSFYLLHDFRIIQAKRFLSRVTPKLSQTTTEKNKLEGVAGRHGGFGYCSRRGLCFAFFALFADKRNKS